jgi:hypothetical protein
MVALLFLSFLFPNLLADNLIKINVTDDITMKIPSEFRAMTDEEIASKYFTMRRPVALYTDQSVTIDLGINEATTQWSNSDLEIMMSFQKSNIYSLFDEITMLSEGIKEVNGRKAAFFEFISKTNPAENSISNKGAILKYIYIQYIIVGNSSWVFNFSSPVRFQGEWQASVEQMMNSIEIKGKK